LPKQEAQSIEPSRQHAYLTSISQNINDTRLISQKENILIVNEDSTVDGRSGLSQAAYEKIGL
jgi:hypothetical protein